jgi:chorismate synthase
MASNSFGKLFRITTWGESHGKAIGVVIDGCPAGLEITEAEINAQLALRAPGRNAYTSPRKENDVAQLYSGVYEGKTTGAPISIIIPNHDADSSKYDAIKDLMRPGHANYTYLQKYGIFDHRGGGRASARETVCRVAAGSIAKKMLKQKGISLIAYIKEIGGVQATINVSEILKNPLLVYQNPLFCPDEVATEAMKSKIEWAIDTKNSLGGIVEFMINGLPCGLGDPVYEKMEALLASAMMSIPASKGFEIGEGFCAARMTGLQHNDTFIHVDEQIRTATNHAGGTLGGITNGMPLIARVAFKPTSSIMTPQATVDKDGKTAVITMPSGSRHDPCVAIRAVQVVEAMAALVVVDALLCNRCVIL